MKRNVAWVGPSLILVLLLFVGMGARDRPTQQKWEYKVVWLSLSGGNITETQAQAQRTLNEQGVEGWEFTGQSEPLNSSHWVLYYFKRLK
jgi:hypothetical protein